MNPNDPKDYWKKYFLVAVIGASFLVIVLSLPRINPNDVVEGVKRVVLPLLGIFALIGWSTYFRMWAVKTFGMAWGLALTLLPILAVTTVVFALSPR